MKRYLISLAICLIGVIFFTIIMGGSLFYLFDIYSLLIIGLFPIIFLCVLFGLKEINLAFSIPLKKEPEKMKLINALNFFKIYNKTIWVVGFLAGLIRTLVMLIALENKAGLGPNLAIIIISLIYCGIIEMVIIIPFTVLIKKHLKE